jgi:glucose/arabinose dehydrogenase
VNKPRIVRVAPNGDVFVSQTGAGHIKALRPSTDGAAVASSATFAEGLVQPFGLAFHPAGHKPKWLSVAENDRRVRYRYGVGETKAFDSPEF